MWVKQIFKDKKNWICFIKIKNKSLKIIKTKNLFNLKKLIKNKIFTYGWDSGIMSSCQEWFSIP